jgi:hypothetical protein
MNGVEERQQMSKLPVRAWMVLWLVAGALVAPISCGSKSSGSGGASGSLAGDSAAAGADSGANGGSLNTGGGAPGDAGSSTASGGGDGCPLYSARCAGSCIATSTDPQNCGACGKACAAKEVCSAGVCSSGCLPGLTVCAQTCADLDNDSANCGGCGKVCKDGQGCAKGRCVNAVPVGPDPKSCVGGGPPITVGTGVPMCLGNVAQTTFRWSLCSCTDLNVSAKLNTDAYDSTKGPYKPGQLGGGVGVDRDVTNWSDAVTIGGTLWVSGSGDYSSSGPPSNVNADLHLGGSWKASTPFTVAGPAFVAGALSGVTVKGATQQVMTVPAPCDCAANQLVPIADIVQAHRAPNNDNDAIGLDEKALENPGAALRLDLPCGNFYLTSIQSSLALTIHVHGRTALYIEGDVSDSSSLAFTLEPTAELDVFIAGNLTTSDTFVFGSPNYPALSRLYVEGSAKMALSNDVRLGGELYAPNSEQLVWSAKNDIYGSVFAGNFRASDVTSIHYDRAVLRAGDGCGGMGGEGGGGSECGSCQDCHNQACTHGVCGDCGADSDCCAPLVCISGSCVPQEVVK